MCSQIASTRKDSTGIYDEMAERVCNCKHAQERAVASTESRDRLLDWKWTTRSAKPNSIRYTTRLRGRLLSLLNTPCPIHVPVHNQRQTVANEPKICTIVPHYVWTNSNINIIVMTTIVFPESSFSSSVFSKNRKIYG